MESSILNLEASAARFNGRRSASTKKLWWTRFTYLQLSSRNLAGLSLCLSLRLSGSPEAGDDQFLHLPLDRRVHLHYIKACKLNLRMNAGGTDRMCTKHCRTTARVDGQFVLWALLTRAMVHLEARAGSPVALAGWLGQRR